MKSRRVSYLCGHSTFLVGFRDLTNPGYHHPYTEEQVAELRADMERTHCPDCTERAVKGDEMEDYPV